MTVINIRALITALNGAKNMPSGLFSAIPWAGDDPTATVDGPDIHFPREITVPILNANPVEPVDLVPLSVPYKVRLRDNISGQILEKYVIVPEAGPVNFGDLVEVDPETYEPTDEVVAAWEAAIAQVEAIRVQALADLQAKIDSADPITDTLMTAVAADPDSDFSQQVSDNLDVLVGNRVTVLENVRSRGTTEERDTYFGVPANAFERAELANRRVNWFNTEYGRHETYFGESGLSGLNVPPLKFAGWMPSEVTERDFPTAQIDLVNLIEGDFKDYRDFMTDMGSVIYGASRGFKSRFGWVVLRGLVQRATATPAGSHILTLPPGWRPTHTKLFPVYHTANGVLQARPLRVDPDGRVTVPVAAVVNSSWSLANIVFNVNPTTADLVLSSPFVPSTSELLGAPGYHKSPDSVLTLSGAISGGSAGSTALVLPAEVRAALAVTASPQLHAMTSDLDGGLAYLNLNYSTGVTAARLKGNMHLSGLVYPGSPKPFQSHFVDYLNGWGTYTGFPAGQAMRTEDGMIILYGLVNGGAVGSAIFNLPPGWRPKGRIIRALVSNENFGRLDIDPSGAVLLITGSNAWASLDGIMFAAEQ